MNSVATGYWLRGDVVDRAEVKNIDLTKLFSGITGKCIRDSRFDRIIEDHEFRWYGNHEIGSFDDKWSWAVNDSKSCPMVKSGAVTFTLVDEVDEFLRKYTWEKGPVI
jgi:hypothetical protein